MRAVALCDAEVEKHRGQNEQGHRVLLPLEGHAEHIAPDHLDHCEQRATKQDDSRGARQDLVLERAPDS